jgi:TIGR03009 family protein
MRHFGLVLTALLLARAIASAQQSAPPAPAANAQAQALDRYLLRWEQEMQKVQTLAAQLSRTDKDKTFDTVQKMVGYAQYKKAGTGPTAMNLAMLQLSLEGRPANEIAEKFICTGTYLYQFMPAQKEIRAYELPKPKPGQVAEDNFLSFLFGMKAEEAKRRYELTLEKEDQWYVYVLILPRFPNDKADFVRARLVLNKDNFLPRQLWFAHANQNETTWDIPRIQSGVQLNQAYFDAPQAPPGWKVVPVARNADVPPRVIRPNN